MGEEGHAAENHRNGTAHGAELVRSTGMQGDRSQPGPVSQLGVAGGKLFWVWTVSGCSALLKASVGLHTGQPRFSPVQPNAVKISQE